MKVELIEHHKIIITNDYGRIIETDFVGTKEEAKQEAKRLVKEVKKDRLYGLSTMQKLKYLNMINELNRS